jgi:UDP:flavonoid glycosyltransferase YjiC (YdhE family)
LPIHPPHPAFVVIAFGSEGDVQPLAALAAALSERGHEVVLLAPQPFAAKAQAQGLRFQSILDEEAAQAVLDNPLLWHPHKGIDVLWPAILQAAQATVTWLDALAARGGPPPCLVGNTMALGARVAHERWGWPHATVHVSACWWFSATEPPLFRGLGWLRWLRPSARAKVWAWIEGRFLDPLAAPGLNAWRAAFALPPVRRVFGRWSASPQCVLGLYPAWFAPLPSDAPRHMQLTGFALPNSAEAAPLAGPLQRFLQADRPTVLLMAGSHMQHAHGFFRTALRACERLGCQALLLGPGAREAAEGEAHAFAQDYAPLEQVLPLCAAVVSHPGIGTIARALAAGVPQLLTPYAFDHFDNARRAVRLGVARQLPPTAGAGRMARALRDLMRDEAVAAACRAAQRRVEPHAAVMAASCAVLEQLRAQALSVAASSA